MTALQLLQIELWAVERLIPYARNARTHSAEQVAQIADSILAFGFNNPVLVDAKGGIIAGHGRVLAARSLQIPQIPVIVLAHLNENEKRAFMLADNKLPLNAGWDPEMLHLELQALAEQGFHLELTGFDERELKELLANPPVLPGADEVPAVAEQAVSMPGDLWRLGSHHRVLCGDGTCEEDLRRVLEGSRCDMVFADLPYNVDYHGKTSRRFDVAERQSGRGVLGISTRCLPGHAGGLPGCALPIYVVGRTRTVAHGLHRMRRALVDVYHLGEKYVRLGIRSLQVSARTDLLRSCGRPERSLVW